MRAPIRMASDPAAIAEAAVRLRAGDLVVFPTETVYGVGANALDAEAVAKVFVAKGRPAADPLIVHLADASMVAQVAREVPATAARLMAAFWPGALTLVLPKALAVPLTVTAGLDTVGVRVPAHPVTRALLEAAGVPVAAPSANRFSRPSPTSAADVAEDLGDRVALILDGGSTTYGVESTVVDVSGGAAVLLRPGAVTVEQLRAVVPELVVRTRAETDPSAPQTSPGTLLKHYAPRADVRLWVGAEARVAAFADIAALVDAGRRVGALLSDDDLVALGRPDVVAASLGPAGAPEEAARRLFAALRALDRAGVEVIVARDPGRTGVAFTVWDRLFRAAEGQVLDSAHR